MAEAAHHVIIGVGIAGSQAAVTLRERDPDSRITIITLGSLLYYNRYDLPRVFLGCEAWRDLIVHQPVYYEEQRMALRRNCQVVNVDSKKRCMTFAHGEDLHFDRLLVCSGGRGYLPEGLVDCRDMMDGFTSYEQAITIKRRLPDEGHVVMLGGDMIGLDLARTCSPPATA